MTTMLSHRPAHYDYTVPYMDKPTHHDVDVILKLYELRREDRMRKARSWLFGYKASNAAEHQAACPPGSDQEAYYRMVTSYWDMAASFVTSGAVNKELFLQNAGELLFVWEKTKGTIADTRKSMGNPKYLSNLETVAQALIENMSKGDPKAYEMFSARVKGMGARLVLCMMKPSSLEIVRWIWSTSLKKTQRGFASGIGFHGIGCGLRRRNRPV